MFRPLVTGLALLALALALPLHAATIEEALAAPDRLPKDLERDQREQPGTIIALLQMNSGAVVQHHCNIPVILAQKLRSDAQGFKETLQGNVVELHLVQKKESKYRAMTFRHYTYDRRLSANSNR